MKHIAAAPLLWLPVLLSMYWVTSAALAKVLYGIKTQILKQAILSAPEMVIFFTYSLLIKEAST